MEKNYSQDLGEEVIAQLRKLISILEKIKEEKDARERTLTPSH